MAEIKKYLHTLDISKNKVTNLLLNPLTTSQRNTVGGTLSNADQGYVCYDTDENKQYFWDGSVWVGSSGASQTLQQVTNIGNTTTNGISIDTSLGNTLNIDNAFINSEALVKSIFKFPQIAVPRNVYFPVSVNGVRADITGDISLSIPPSYITSVSNTSTIELDVTAGNLTANFASLDVSQFTNDSGYITNLTGFTTDDLTEGTTNLYDKTVALTSGTGISISGTYPNFTITNTGIYTSPLTTKGDIFVRNASGDTRLPIGLDTQVLLVDSTQPTGLKWGSNTAPTPLGYYGAFQDNITQTAAVSNVGYPMIFRTTDLSNGVTVVSNGTNLTRITFANTGVYNLQFSSQFQNIGNSEADVTIWIRKNGTDVPGSAGFVTVPKRTSAGTGNEGHCVTGWNYLLDVIGGQYYEIMWSTTNAANVTMQYYSAGNPPPSTASVIATVTQQSGIMAGTGITALNGLTGAVQTFGNDTNVTIVSSGTTHTLTWSGTLADSRIASASTWNSKQAGSTNLTSLSGLTYSATSFVKMTAAGTFSLDTNTYLTTSSASSTYFPLVGGTLTGTAGAGFFGAIAQSSNPSAPASGFRLYADSTGKFSWIGANGYIRTFDGTANTADRTYTLPNASGTIALTSDIPTISGTGLVYSTAGVLSYKTQSDAGWTAWTEAITWTATTAPSGTANNYYRWSQVGKWVHLEIRLNYANTGSAITQIRTNLPSSMPLPSVATNWGTGTIGDILFYSIGNLSTTFTGLGNSLFCSIVFGDGASSRSNKIQMNMNSTTASKYIYKIDYLTD